MKFILIATICILSACTSEKPEWQNYNDTDIAKLTEQGKTVLVQYTADWCATCQRQEENIFQSEKITKLFKEKNVVWIKADWTNYSSSIKKKIDLHGQSGVPMYVVHSASSKKNGKLLPKHITEKDIIDNI